MVATEANMIVVGLEDSPVLWVEPFEILKQFGKWKGICWTRWMSKIYFPILCIIDVSRGGLVSEFRSITNFQDI